MPTSRRSCIITINDKPRTYNSADDLYAHFEVLRGSVGFVPQQDIIHDDLTLADTLGYAALMRMPHDATEEQRQAKIAEVLHKMHLEEVTQNMVRNLSGGQKKRASIAVELLSDPQLLILDEPTSGLDPSLEQHFMEELRDMSGASGGRIASYVLSKLCVLGALCLVQAALFTGTFCHFVSLPEGMSWLASSMMLVPIELFATSAFIMLSAMCLGLFVSALFKNPDRAIACAPLLIMPQILFAGVVVKLEGVVEKISYFVTCRWGMSGYGTTAHLTTLNKAIVGEIINGTEVEASWDLSALCPAADEAMYEQGIFGILSAWSVMLVMCALFVGLCLALLRLGTRKKHR